MTNLSTEFTLFTKKTLEICSETLKNYVYCNKKMNNRLFLILLLMYCSSSYAQRLVKDLTPGVGGTFTSYMGNTKHGFIFYNTDNQYGTEPWVSDGTEAGTKLLKDIVPGQTSSLASDYSYSNDSLLFFLANEMGKYKLWRTDGSSEGTFKLFDFESKPPVKSYDEGIFCNGKFYFNHPHGGKNSLWSSDGSVAGTQLVYEFNDSGMNARIALNEWRGELMFFAGDTAHGMELWRSNGTTAGTSFVKDIYPGKKSSVQLSRTKMAAADGRMFFAAISDDVSGYELFVTDGTESGTKLFIDLNPKPYISSYPAIVKGNDSVILFNTQSTVGKAWKSDGTIKNTKPIIETGKDSNKITLVYNTFPFKDGNLMYLYTTEFGTELYTCDHKLNNVEILKDINPGFNSSFSEGICYPSGNKSYFLAFNNMLGDAIWVTDGTNDNTLVYLELASNSVNEYLIKWNNRFFFAGSLDINIGTELYELIIENTGIEKSTVNTFNLYPNPVKAGKFLAISEPVCTYQLHNTLGQLVLEGETTEGKCLIPEKLSAGMYTITIQNEQATQTSLIVIE